MIREDGHYPLWLRVWHWSNLFLFLVLLTTGIQMHYYQAAVHLISFRTCFFIHNVAGILLLLIYMLFMLGNLFRDNGRYYRIKLEDIWPGILKQAVYYLNGIFLGRPHPYPHGENRKFNPIQKLTYLAVVWALFPTIIITGLALLVPRYIPVSIMGMSGIAFLAFIHTYVAFFFSIFMVVHMYLATTGHTISELYLLMLFGDKAGHKEEEGTEGAH